MPCDTNKTYQGTNIPGDGPLAGFCKLTEVIKPAREPSPGMFKKNKNILNKKEGFKIFCRI
jgi:hypothetical protein